MRITLQLIKGDVRDVSGIDCLLLGKRCPLKQAIVEETGEEFVRISPKADSWAKASFDVLLSDDFQWKRTISVNLQSRNILTESQFSKISDALLYAMHAKRGNSIAILPFSARHPDNIALGTILSLWHLAYTKITSRVWLDVMIDSFIYPKGYSPKHKGLYMQDTSFKIVSYDSLEPYGKVLENDCKIMWEYLALHLRKYDANQRQKGKVSQTFEVEYPKMKSTAIHFDIERLEV